jgi:hypothetical protein
MVLNGRLMMTISRQLPRLSPNPPEFIRDAFRLLEPILLAYSDQYRFRQKSIYLDSKTAPLRHIRSYYLLARLCEESHINHSKSFPYAHPGCQISPDRHEDFTPLFLV